MNNSPVLSLSHESCSPERLSSPVFEHLALWIQCWQYAATRFSFGQEEKQYASRTAVWMCRRARETKADVCFISLSPVFKESIDNFGKQSSSCCMNAGPENHRVFSSFGSRSLQGSNTPWERMSAGLIDPLTWFHCYSEVYCRISLTRFATKVLKRCCLFFMYWMVSEESDRKHIRTIGKSSSLINKR